MSEAIKKARIKNEELKKLYKKFGVLV